MNDTIKPPAPFEPIPVGGPAAVLDMPRQTMPLPPRPAPRQTMPLPPLPDAEPKSPAPLRAALPSAIAPETPPADANPLAGSPPPKASVFSGILWDLIRPNRAKVAVLAGVASLAVGAFGLNMLFPTFGNTPAEQSKVKLKIPAEEPKPLAAAPTPPAGGWDPIAIDPKPPLPPRIGNGDAVREQPKAADGLPGLPALPPFGAAGGAESPVPKPLEAPMIPFIDPNLRRTSGVGEMPALPPVAPGPLPVPGGPGPGPAPGLPALPPGGPVIPGGAGDPPVLPGLPPAPGPAAPKPLEQPPALPGVGGGPVAPEPMKPALPGLPPVVVNPFPDDKKPLPTPTGGVGGDPLPAVGALPLPGVPGLPAPGGPELKPPPTPTPGDVKPLPLPPVPGEVKPVELKPAQPDLLPLGTPPVPAARPGTFEPTAGTEPVRTPPAVGWPTTGGPAATLQPPVTEAKTEYDVDLHRPRAGDTYATVSKAYYGGAQYAGALQSFNKNQPLERLGEVQVPPVHVIRKFAPARGGDPVPDRFTPTRPAANDDGPEWGAPGAAVGGQTVFTLFKVPRTGMTLRDVAKTFYGNERNWAKLNNPRNPKFDPDEELPVGTQLQVPTESLPFR